jgi:hypothetical protein
LGADPDTNVSKTSTVGAQPCLHRTKLPPATVLTVLTIATAWFGGGLIRRAQALRGQVGWASAILLWLAGLRRPLLAHHHQAVLTIGTDSDRPTVTNLLVTMFNVGAAITGASWGERIWNAPRLRTAGVGGLLVR